MIIVHVGQPFQVWESPWQHEIKQQYSHILDHWRGVPGVYTMGNLHGDRSTLSCRSDSPPVVL